MINIKRMLILAAITTISVTFLGCASSTGKSKTNFEKIKNHSELALKKCGKGKVKTVNVDGFTCFT